MTNEERVIITRFVARVGGGAQQDFAGGSVPATQLPSVDKDADGYISQLFNQYPEARYRITQLAFVQEYALGEAQNRIKRLEWEVQQAQQASQQKSGSASGGGFFSGLFGGDARQQQSGPGSSEPTGPATRPPDPGAR
jgi:hypothetical protein